MRRPLLLILLAGLLVSLGGCDSGPKIRALSPDAVIMAFGDSLTRGTGAPAGQSYPEVLAARLGRSVINAGIPGEVSAEGLRRLPGVLAEQRPDLVILCHGGNDFLRRHDKEETAANLRGMIELVRGEGIDLVLVGVPELGFGLYVPEFYAALAEEFALPFEDEILVELLGDRDMKSDTIHPNAAGYQRMAEAIAGLIERAGER